MPHHEDVWKQYSKVREYHRILSNSNSITFYFSEELIEMVQEADKRKDGKIDYKCA